MHSLKTGLRSVPGHIWILLIVIVVGIFLRTFHFRDWLAWNPDQARDAGIISRALEGQAPLPPLGPIAGGTLFQVGPMFYYFQYAAGFLFDNKPEVMAFPDLFFSILTIPLFYYFLRRYFSVHTALALTALESVSYFMVVNSRFAWNPNSIPFFVLLFLIGLFGLLGDRPKISRAIIAGIAIGVGIQLHTLLLVIMPIVAALFFGYLRKNRRFSWRLFAGVVLTALLLNASQIIHEVRTDGQNIQEFFRGADKNSGSKVGLIGNVSTIGICTVVTNTHFLSSLADKEECVDNIAIPKTAKLSPVERYLQEGRHILLVITSLAFSIAGYTLLIRRFRQETVIEKKHFLGVILLFSSISLLVFVPVAGAITSRYFIITFFMPFVLLGLIMETFLRHCRASQTALVIPLTVGTIIAFNISAEIQSAERLSAHKANDGENSVLGETEVMADYIIAHAHGSTTVYLDGGQNYVRRYFGPLAYLLRARGFELKALDETSIHPDAPIFLVVKSDAKKQSIGGNIDQYSIRQIQTFHNITIIIPE